MRQLHLVGFTTDHRQLIFSAKKDAKSGGYTVALDDNLVGLLDEALRRRDGGEGDRLEQHRRLGRQESQLSPREIQARLRSGSTLAQVASDAGVDVEWVSRFAAPILAEQAQVVGRARELYYTTLRKGSSSQPLGTAVRWTVADRGVRLGDDEFDSSWGAFQLRDGNWVVRFSFTSRQRPQLAEWEVDFQEGTVTARNRLAANLGYVPPRTRPPAANLLESAAPAQPPPPSSSEEPAAAARGRTAPAWKASRGSATKTKATARKKATAKKKAATKRAAKKAAKRKAEGRRAPPAKKKAPAKRSPRKTTARKAPAKSAARKTAAKKAAKTATAKKKAAAKRAAPRKATARRATARKATATSAAKKARPRAKKKGAKRKATASKRPPSKKKAARVATVRPALEAPAPLALNPAPPVQPLQQPPPREARAFATPAVPAAHEPRSVRRARARHLAADEPPPPETTAPPAPQRPPSSDRVVTIRADRAAPPTESQLATVRRRSSRQ